MELLTSNRGSVAPPRGGPCISPDRWWLRRFLPVIIMMAVRQVFFDAKIDQFPKGQASLKSVDAGLDDEVPIQVADRVFVRVHGSVSVLFPRVFRQRTTIRGPLAIDVGHAGHVRSVNTHGHVGSGWPHTVSPNNRMAVGDVAV
jgi:hypothetical protein